MDDRSQEAHNKWQEDFKKSGGQADSNPITEFIHPSYDPPSGHEEDYKGGWDNAKKQSSK